MATITATVMATNMVTLMTVVRARNSTSYALNTLIVAPFKAKQQ